jgi:hypothetical protein
MKTKKLNSKDQGNCFVEFIKSFDFYKDLPDSLSEPTLTGASISIVLMSIIVALVLQRTYAFLNLKKCTKMITSKRKSTSIKLSRRQLLPSTTRKGASFLASFSSTKYQVISILVGIIIRRQSKDSTCKARSLILLIKLTI